MAYSMSVMLTQRTAVAFDERWSGVTNSGIMVTATRTLPFVVYSQVTIIAPLTNTRHTRQATHLLSENEEHGCS